MSKPEHVQPTVPQCLTISELMKRTRLGRTLISQALSRGELEHYRIGSRAVIPESAAVAWLESQRISKSPKLCNRTTPPAL
jgi:excisionase family DNA binding protein